MAMTEKDATVILAMDFSFMKDPNSFLARYKETSMTKNDVMVVAAAAPVIPYFWIRT